MSTIKSSDEHLTLNADGSSKDIKFQANGVEKASISSAGAFTSTTIDATKLTGALPAISGASLTGIPSFKQNIVKNGGFDVWQRGTSFTYTSGKNFIADRWWVTPNSGAHTQTREAAGLDGFNYCLRMQRNASQTAVGVVYLNNEFESRDSMQFRGKKLTLSFYARKGANFSQANSYLTSNVASGTGTDQTLSTGFTGGVNLISQNNTLTTSWQRFTHTTGSVLATTVNQIAIQFTTAHEGTAGAADYYEITGVQLEEGDSATDFVHRSYGEELALCQRYFSKSVLLSDVNGGFVFTGFNGNEAWGGNHFPVTMRATPTVTMYNYGGTAGGVHKIGSPDISGVAASSISNTGVPQVTKSGGFSAGALYVGNYKADAEL